MPKVQQRTLRLFWLLAEARALTFTVAGNETRCIGESIPAMALLTGDWRLNATQSVTTILSPSNVVVFEKHDASGHFAVTAQQEGVHRVCVHNNDTEKRDVTISIKTALEVADHASVAKKEHVEAIEAELDRMNKMAVHVYEEMLYMRSRSETIQVRSMLVAVSLLRLMYGARSEIPPIGR